MMLSVLFVMICLVNIPFGCWRVNVKRFSFPWFLAVHLPIPFVMIVRMLCGVSWQMKTFPILAGAYFAGQYLGGSFSTYRKK
jgi:hypothetical protein